MYFASSLQFFSLFLHSHPPAILCFLSSHLLLGHEPRTLSLFDKLFRHLVYGSNLSSSFGILILLVNMETSQLYARLQSYAACHYSNPPHMAEKYSLNKDDCWILLCITHTHICGPNFQKKLFVLIF